MVGGGGGLCLVTGTSLKSQQPNLPWFPTVVTAVWALQTAPAQAESLELGIDHPSPPASPQTLLAGPFLGLAPSCLLTRSD